MCNYIQNCLFLLFLISCKGVLAGSYHVSTSGSDSQEADGLSPETAWASLYYAADRIKDVQGNHTIFLEAGVFVENLPIKLNNRISVIGRGTDKTIIESNLNDFLINMENSYGCFDGSEECTPKWVKEIEGNGDQVIKHIRFVHQSKTPLSAGIILKSRHNVTFDSLEFRNFHASALGISAVTNYNFNAMPSYFLSGIRISNLVFENCGGKIEERISGAISLAHLDGAEVRNIKIFHAQNAEENISAGFKAGMEGWIKNTSIQDIDVQLVLRETGPTYAFELRNVLENNIINNLRTNGSILISNSFLANSISSDNNLTISNSTFISDNRRKYFYIGVQCSGLKLKGNYFFGSGGADITLIRTLSGEDFVKKNIHIEENVFESLECETGRSRIFYVQHTSSSNIKILNNTVVRKLGFINIDSEPGETTSGVKVYNNLFVECCDDLYVNSSEGEVEGWQIGHNFYDNCTGELHSVVNKNNTANGLYFENNQTASVTHNASQLILAGAKPDYYRPRCNSVVLQAGKDVSLPYEGQKPAIGAFDENCTYPMLVTIFSGKLQSDGTGYLYWSVKNERHVKKYLLKRSYDGENFSTIAELEAQRFTGLENEYEFLDEGLKKKNYYRLIQQMENGEEQIYDRVSIEIPVFGMSYIYPIPAVDEIRFTITSDKETPVKINLLDVLGRRHFYSRDFVSIGANEFVLNISSIANGLYFVQVIDETSKSYISKQVIVNR
ncbi:MAG: T9SS type A sorting domain-containing protein [Cytophagaceae bacterium]